MRKSPKPEYALVLFKGEVATIWYALMEHAKRMPDGDKVRALIHKVERQSNDGFTEEELVYGSLELIKGYNLVQQRKR